MGINRRHYYKDQHTVATGSHISSLARHWQARYPTGKALIITSQPENTAKQLTKQWQRLTNVLQIKRAAAVGADDILRLTSIITHMQQMACAPTSPSEQPAAHVWCTSDIPDSPLPLSCRTTYVLRRLHEAELRAIKAAAPNHTLFVDYSASIPAGTFTPKSDLVATCDQLWHELEAFLVKHDIAVDTLIAPTLEQPMHLDDALDTLLGVSSSFLRIAHQFQEAWQLAQPFEPNHHEQQAYETMLDLARRVATLSPSYFKRYVPDIKNDDELSLYDSAYAAQQWQTSGETVARHIRAGRSRLAAALENSIT